MRAALIVLDSVGIGQAPDAKDYGDEGADTLGHLIGRDASLPRRLPTLWSLGLGNIIGINPVRAPGASYGRMTEVSTGKDSTTGHWEIAGAVITEPFGLFDRFPAELVDAIEREAGVKFIGNCAASGTAIIDQLGPEHLRSGNLILYTSADSVLQIAAHEQIVPLARLYEVCRIARRHADRYRIGRVIARPFVGSPGTFQRTAGRHDFSMDPPRTVLDCLRESGQPVTAIGKIGDLFAGRAIDQVYPTRSNAEGMHHTEQLWSQMTGGLLFVNLVDFDMLFGHRRDADGYAHALISFDGWLKDFVPMCREQDLLIITADHGNDPTYFGTDHTREQVPLIVCHKRCAENLGSRESFADVAASLCDFFNLPSSSTGASFLHS
ncbi:MAG TPA: phosphopentomutase [Tepidisphaeraceae bacterium]|nr:phosphopentomutase [Tepidisphaeraceae bacterium]